MLKKTITYTDYNGVERTEPHYFNLSKPELVKMEAGTTGGLSNMIERIAATQDVSAIMKIYDDLITKSYGVKSLDGKRFEKSEELTAEFVQSEAYSVLFMEFIEHPESFADFIKGIIPPDMLTAAKPAIEQATN